MTQTQTSPANQQAQINAAIAALAASQLAQLWPLVDWTSPDAVNAVKTAYRAVTTQFGQASASRAAEFYDDVRATQNIKQAFRAIPSDPLPQALLDSVVDSAFLGNSQTPEVVPGDHPEDFTTSELSVDERVQQRLDGKLQRLVLQPGRDTIADNVDADPVQPRYVRVPQGATTCAFCVMLASRDSAIILGKTIDMTYRSAQSAQFVVGRGRDAIRAGGKRPLGEKYHDHCDCEPVPIFPGQVPSDVSPNFHDYQDQYYKATADAGTSSNTKKILASMRQLHGLK